jgi:RNA polymerase sigma-70 factor (ECF subfamily)
LHILRNQADAEDATQNAFVRAFTNLGRFDERRPFAPWLLRIVAREALKVLRAERTRFALWQRQTQVVESQETVESIVLARAEHRDLWSALRRLKTNDQLVLVLTYFMGLGEEDVAVTLGIKRGTVKSRKHNALARLRALVERDFPGLAGQALERPELEEASP